jgi:hypothetical protein
MASDRQNSTTTSSFTSVEEEPWFVAPTRGALAQALCLANCATNRSWKTCTFDGYCCDDRYSDAFMRPAWEALKDV